MSHIQTTQAICILLKGPAPSYLVLKFDNIMPINNGVVAQKCDFAKVKVIGQNKWHHQIP